MKTVLIIAMLFVGSIVAADAQLPLPPHPSGHHPQLPPHPPLPPRPPRPPLPPLPHRHVVHKPVRHHYKHYHRPVRHHHYKHKKYSFISYPGTTAYYA